MANLRAKGIWGRLLVWLLLIPVTLAAAAGPVWVVAIYALLWIGLSSYEYLSLYLKPFKFYHGLFILGPVIVWIYPLFPDFLPLGCYLFGAILIQLILWLFFFPSRYRLLIPLLLIPFYLGLLPLHFVLLKITSLEQGLGYAWMIFPFVMNWVNDTAAYFTGRSLGKTPLCSKLSPAKTVEGLIGGLIFTVAFGIGFGLLFLPEQPWWFNVILSVGVWGAGTAGDLLESGIKRERRVKNTSVILAGHGGFLDRVDSLLFAAPLYFYLYMMLEKVCV
ncbi:hypothetical protein GF359_08610 [candidate division WOR-3 bacterium]|uniref:Phosphatidate cytidylyltransferase n=1 Tax=candidate division WOR-3 bacterium TaxID=2052148 RepID=A0A9D5QDP3_UNCW3|nr:hypothetical protein [candidate division WOR-3 bacterium]MBD3365261.1 hypothetical protein [candidate division WOR-3 bacterium]